MKETLDFMFELGMQKRVDREGWKILGIRHPETIGEHTLRTAQLAFILAKMEGHNNPQKVCTMAVFHEIGECRIGDLHKIASRYSGPKEGEAVRDQTKALGEIGGEISSMWQETEDKSSDAGIIVKDADYLETAIQAKEYMEEGYSKAEDWITNCGNRLNTESAKKLHCALLSHSSSEWWQGLKKFRGE